MSMIANKWFLGCSYPDGVHKIIDEWEAPQKRDYDRIKQKSQKQSQIKK